MKVLKRYPKIKKVIIFSRDELKQHEISLSLNDFQKKKVRFFLGDIRDKNRLLSAFSDVDCVVHAAALKQVTTAEYNPLEFVKTNIIGAQNIVEAAIQMNVKKVIALSTDKACSPINLYIIIVMLKGIIILKMKKKILIHCPANSTTGGPEALHQFCSEAQKYIDCKICYYTNNDSNIPKKFDIYNVSKSNFFDDKNTFHLIPEISTKYFANKISQGKIIIYWLSVDNFFNLKDRSRILNLFYYFLALLTHRKPIILLKKYLHLSQSEYSNSFLKKNNFKFNFVGDYIRDECYDLNSKRKKIIMCFIIPKKGWTNYHL